MELRTQQLHSLVFTATYPSVAVAVLSGSDRGSAATDTSDLLAENARLRARISELEARARLDDVS